MADVMTIEEHRGPIRGKTLAWVGDGNNVLTSLVHAAVRLDFALNIADPGRAGARAGGVAWAAERQGRVRLTERCRRGGRGADAVFTDTWVSMGQDDRGPPAALLEPYRVDARADGARRRPTRCSCTACRPIAARR